MLSVLDSRFWIGYRKRMLAALVFGGLLTLIARTLRQAQRDPRDAEDGLVKQWNSGRSLKLASLLLNDPYETPIYDYYTLFNTYWL